jgi:hypothetical protein
LLHLPQGSTNQGAANERPSSAFRSEAVESYMVIIGIGRRGQKPDGAVLINSADRPGGHLRTTGSPIPA